MHTLNLNGAYKISGRDHVLIEPIFDKPVIRFVSLLGHRPVITLIDLERDAEYHPHSSHIALEILIDRCFSHLMQHLDLQEPEDDDDRLDEACRIVRDTPEAQMLDRIQAEFGVDLRLMPSEPMPCWKAFAMRLIALSL